jgi:CHAT domain-containing protein
VALDDGDLTLAQGIAGQGMSRAQATGDAPLVRSFEVLRAEVLMKRRDAKGALEILSSREPSGTETEVRVRSLMTAGYARCQLAKHSAGDMATAFEQLGEAERLAGEVKLEPLQAEVWLRRGSCMLGDETMHPAAEALFQRALRAGATAGQRHLQANAAGSLGLLRVRSARYDDAADWLERSLALSKGLNADTIDAKVLVNLGWCYTLLGDPEKALPLLQQAEAKARRHGYTEELEVALFHAGTCHLQKGDLPQAIASFEGALKVAQTLGRGDDQREILDLLQTVALRNGDHGGAERYARDAAALSRLADGREAPPSLSEAQLKTEQRDFASAERLYREIHAGARSADTRWRALAGLAGIYVTTQRYAEADRAFGQADVAAERLRAELREDTYPFLLYSSLTEFYGRYVAFLVDRGRAAEALAVVERNRGRVLWDHITSARAQAATAGRFEDVARASQAVLLAYWLGERSFLWVVTPHSTEVHPLPSAQVLRSRVERYNSLLKRFKDPATMGDTGRADLYDLLVGPAARHIPKGARVIVVADGPLNQLSFDTLVVPGPEPHYWLEDVVSMRTPSLSVLSPSRTRPAKRNRTLLLVGDPVQPSEAFPALPNATTEMESVKKYFASASTLVIAGNRATPSAFRAARPERFGVIHFVAHATSNRERPLESAVVLSGDGTEYKLYAREIVDLPISADIVTLSACGGAGSRSYGGEGLVGLAWAFLHAGARHVIAGLWDVEDASTAQLMDGLYQGMANGLSPPEALREARLRFLRATDNAHRKPYYWGPFVVFVQQELLHPTVPQQ